MKNTNYSADKWNILIVDDVENVHTQTKIALRSIKYNNKKLNILNASSAKEAKEIINNDTNNSLALVLLDIVMENNEPTGFDVVQYLREEKRNNRTQIVIRTGQAGRTLSNELSLYMDYDVNGVILKGEESVIKIKIVVVSALKAYDYINKEREYIELLEQKNEELEKSKHEISSLCLLSQKKYIKKFNKEITDNNINIVINTLIDYFKALEQSDSIVFDDIAVEFIKNIDKEKYDIRVLFNIIEYCFSKRKSDTIGLALTEKAYKHIKGNLISIMKWEGEKQELKDLHNALTGNNSSEIVFIDCSYEDFVYHFNENPYSENKINWLYDHADFVHLFYELINLGYFTDMFKSRVFSELSNHFIIKGQKISSRSLSAIKSENINDKGIWGDANNKSKIINQILDDYLK